MGGGAAANVVPLLLAKGGTLHETREQTGINAMNRHPEKNFLGLYYERTTSLHRLRRSGLAHRVDPAAAGSK